MNAHPNNPRMEMEGARGAAAAPRTAPFVETPPAAEPPLTPGEAVIVDARQDRLMARESVDGQPPSHRQRAFEWRWAAVVAAVLLLGALTWAVIRGTSIAAMLGIGAAFCLVLVLGGWPVLAAAMFRGKEQADARAQAVAIVRPKQQP